MTDFEEKIRDSKNCIEDSSVHNPKEIYQKSLSVKPRFKLKDFLKPRLIVRYVVFALAVLASFTWGMTLVKNNNEDRVIYHQDENGDIIINRVINNKENTPLSFVKFKTEEELLEYLTNSKGSTTQSGIKQRGSGWFSLNDEQMAEAEPTNSDTQYAPKGESDSTYKTNVTVENVDEADIVKVIGNHIFYLPSVKYDENNKVHMLEEENGVLKLIKTIEFNKEKELIKTENGYNLLQVEDDFAQNLYVTDRYLIVQISHMSYKVLQKVGEKENEFGYYDYTNACIFQVYDIKSLELVTTIKTSGSNVSTRLVKDTLYVVNNYYDYLYTNNSMYYAPYYYVDDTLFSYRLNNIYCIKDGDTSQKAYVSVYKIILNEEVTVSDIHVITPSVNNIYATTKNIYLLRTYSNVIENGEEYQLSYNTSRVVVINIEDDLELLGDFTVKGRIIDKYAIDEKDDYIRVVTTGNEYKQYYIDQKYVYKSESTVFNHLTIFKKTDDGFVQTSAITEGLGKPGETVRSARFNGDMVTIVTFRNTDPLYYVDITDPLNPVITSSLQITGYSVYQHPYKDNVVIGFGYEADTNGRTIGYKITLFDVSDKNDIKEIGVPFIIKYSEFLENTNTRSYVNTPEFFSDPKALFVNLDKDIFGFRLTSTKYEYNNSNNRYYHQYLTDYLVFKIDLNCKTPLQLILRESTENDDNNYFSDYFERMVFVDNYYYLLSAKDIHCYKFDGDNFYGNNKFPLE